MTPKRVKVKWEGYSGINEIDVQDGNAFARLIGEYFEMFKCMPDDRVKLDIGTRAPAKIKSIVFAKEEILISIF